MTFRELCKKQVVQTQEGVCLGRVDDLRFSPQDGRIESFILYGRPKWFGLLGREPDLVIPIDRVDVFGADALLVTVSAPQPGKEKVFPSFPGQKSV